MSEIPWFAKSPSPFTIVFYAILALWGTRKLLKVGKYKRFKHLIAFTDAIFTIGFVVLTLDTLWIMACALRFGWFYPDSILQLVFAGGRNLTGVIFCYLLIGGYFKKRLLQLENASWVFTLNVLFLITWFALASSPAWTDWTYAIRHNYPLNTVLTSFFISHFIGKTIAAVAYIKVWQIPLWPDTPNAKQ